jgi:hypothetical protein
MLIKSKKWCARNFHVNTDVWVRRTLAELNVQVTRSFHLTKSHPSTRVRTLPCTRSRTLFDDA